MLWQRILTAAVLLPLFLAALFLLPNLYWVLLLAALLTVAAREWARLAGFATAGQATYALAALIVALAIAALDHGAGATHAFVYSAPGKLLYALCAAFWFAIAPAWLYYRWVVRSRPLLAVVGMVVLLPLWHALAWLQLMPERLLVALAVVWTADTAAYFAGRRFGRHKLAPAISPGKTWEGVAGALAAVCTGWVALALLAPEFRGQLASGLALVVVLTAMSIEGDLFESWMKRQAGLKDSGALLPGHGGLLDRVDALTSTVPLAALYFAYPLLRG
ncbi:MAG TPA: phosphatidate cytidylyltransferase [Burkholderiales bacterium]|nr:phosphatidate cytidylyltransferase [Burkholderiales bacterium]